METNSEITPSHNEDFSKIVEESKAKIHDAAMVEVKKRGRGRPQKTLQNSNNTNSTPQSNPIQGISTVGPIQPPPDITPYLVEPMLAVSKIPARKYGIPELAFTREEAQLCSQALNDCLRAFIPDLNSMSPKTAAILGLCVTIGSVGFSKYQVYLEHKPKTEKPEPEIQVTNSENQKNFGQSAEDYFKKQ